MSIETETGLYFYLYFCAWLMVDKLLGVAVGVQNSPYGGAVELLDHNSRALPPLLCI